MKRIISITLALLLLLGNVGLTYGTHFCGGHAVIGEFMMGESHLDCGMGMMDMEHSEADTNISAPDCCSNQYISADVDDVTKKELNSELITPFVTIAVAAVLFTFTPIHETKALPIVNTSPPILEQDFQSSYQVYLI